MALPPTNPPGLVRDAEDLNKVVNGDGTTNRAGDSLPSLGQILSVVQERRDSALIAIDGYESAVDSARASAITTISGYESDVNSARSSAITTISGYESDVNSARSSAITTINSRVSEVNTNASQAQTAIQAARDGVQGDLEAKLDSVGFLYLDPDTFETGATVENAQQALRYEADGEYYRYRGEFPVVVPAESSPVGDPLWVATGFNALLQDLQSFDAGKGAALITRGVISVISIQELRDLPVSARRTDLTVIIKGHTTPHDGGAGNFYFDQEQVGIDDNGHIINGWVRDSKSVWLAHYGVFPNSQQNETEGITAAIDRHLETGKRLRGEFGEYLFDGITRIGKSDITIEGVGVGSGYLTFKSTAVDQRTLRFECSNDEIQVSLGEDVTVGSSNVLLSDASTLSEGMLIRITSTALWPYDNRGVYFRGETHLIDRIEGNRVFFTDSTRDNYLTTEIDNITAWMPASLSLRNIFVDQSDFRGDACYQISGYLNPHFENVRSRKSKTAGLWLLRCWMPNAKNIYSEFIGDGIQAGYGVQDRSCVGTYINGLFTVGCRRSFDANSQTGSQSSPSRDYRVVNFDVRGGGDYHPNTEEVSYGIGNHGASENGSYSSGKIFDCRIGVNHRGLNLNLSDIDVIGNTLVPVDASFGDGYQSHNVNYYSSEFPVSSSALNSIDPDKLPLCFIRFGRTSGDDADFKFKLPVIISGCNAVGVKDSFIFSEGNTQALGNIMAFGNSITPLDDAQMSPFRIVRHLSTFSRSSLSSNEVILDQRAWQVCNTTFGQRGAGNDRYAVKVDSDYVFRIDNDDFIIIPGTTKYPGSRPIITISGDAGGREMLELRPNNGSRQTFSTQSFAAMEVTAQAESINGTFGNDGVVTIGLAANGDIYIENRLGNVRSFRLSVAV